MPEDTDVISPARRRGFVTLWTAVAILSAAAVAGVVFAAVATSGHPRTARVFPTNPPTPTAPAATPATVVGTWRIVRVPGINTYIHVPGQPDATPATRVVTKTVPVPGPTVTVPAPTVTVTVTCTKTVTAPPPTPTLGQPGPPSVSCTTSAPSVAP